MTTITVALKIRVPRWGTQEIEIDFFFLFAKKKKKKKKKKEKGMDRQLVKLNYLLV